MQRTYREKKYYCGDYLVVAIYPVYTHPRKREKWSKPTVERDDGGIVPYKLHSSPIRAIIRLRKRGRVMVKVLFVCHGNICRSPMGEYVLKDMVRKAGLAGLFEVASAAVSTEELGNPVYPPARRELASHGIACDGHRARQITRRDLDYYDRIYYMDSSNARWLRRLFGKDADKCRKLLDRDVADPWYTGDFRQTWEDICQGCEMILEEFG